MNILFTTQSAKETRLVAHTFAKTLCGGDTVLLEGDLGAGKTTFAQGLLEALGGEKPYTSPTFVICKTYELPDGKRKTENGKKNESPLPILHSPLSVIRIVHHIDTYRIESKDLLDLGWNDMITDPHAITILEWPERVRNILPETAKKVFFTHKGEDVREIRWE